jgi:glycosidase
MPVPFWVQDAIFYQIFPDRFANGDPRNDPRGLEPWGSPPTQHGFQGGDLRGVIHRLDYLMDLGVNALYLNPIFLSTSTHRYNTLDYYQIDPRLGRMEDFHALITAAHDNQMRIILDGVFNHSGRGFFAFTDLLENQEHSLYRNWYHVKRFPVDAFSPGSADSYLGWWGLKSLPKFNTNNPDVRKYLLGVARYWIEQGIDGWRLDVPNEIDDDSFWAEFREIVKSANPEAYLVGEIWTPDPRWVGEAHFDGLMHYPLRETLLEFLNGSFMTTTQFADRVEGFLNLYPRQNVYAMYLPLGSHDTERLLTTLKDLRKVRLAFAFQFAYPGSPAIYYGDEIGMEGGKDPDCRRAFPSDPAEWNNDLRRWVQLLATLRRRLAPLRRGEYRRLFLDDKRRLYAFARSLGREHVLVALNGGPVRRNVQIPVGSLDWEDGRIVRNLLNREEFIVSGDKLILRLDPWEAAWIA